MPLCQRCTGMYAGAALSLLFLLLFRPALDTHYRWMHTMLLMAMTPFGFHLVPQGDFLRTMSGQWFGFGIAGLLWLSARKTHAEEKRGGHRLTGHVVAGAASIVLLPPYAKWGGILAAVTLPWLSLAGMAVLVGLLAANIGRCLFTAIAWSGVWATRACT